MKFDNEKMSRQPSSKKKSNQKIKKKPINESIMIHEENSFEIKIEKSSTINFEKNLSNDEKNVEIET